MRSSFYFSAVIGLLVISNGALASPKISFNEIRIRSLIFYKLADSLKQKVKNLQITRLEYTMSYPNIGDEFDNYNVHYNFQTDCSSNIIYNFSQSAHFYENGTIYLNTTTGKTNNGTKVNASTFFKNDNYLLKIYNAYTPQYNAFQGEEVINYCEDN